MSKRVPDRAPDDRERLLGCKRLTASQIEFVNLVIDLLTENGFMDAALLYESPFKDLTPQGPNTLFDPTRVDDSIATLSAVRATAIAA